MNIFKLATLPVAALLACGVDAADGVAQIESGSRVTFDYSLTLDDGTIVDSSQGREPMAYTQGGGQIIPGLEDAMTGHSAGDTFKVTVQPEDAYGLVDPQRVQEVPLDAVPEDARVVGATLTAQNFPGPIRVQEVREDVVVLDFNHPLAGEVLTFDINVVTVEAPAAGP